MKEGSTAASGRPMSSIETLKHQNKTTQRGYFEGKRVTVSSHTHTYMHKNMTFCTNPGFCLQSLVVL